MLLRQSDVQKRCNQRECFAGVDSRQLERGLQLLCLFLCRLIAAPPERLIKHLAYRVEGRVLKNLRRGSLDRNMRRIPDQFMEALYQARFADAWLAHDQYRLALTLHGMLPAIRKQVQLIFTPDKRCQP